MWALACVRTSPTLTALSNSVSASRPSVSTAIRRSPLALIHLAAAWPSWGFEAPNTEVVGIGLRYPRKRRVAKVGDDRDLVVFQDDGLLECGLRVVAQGDHRGHLVGDQLIRRLDGPGHRAPVVQEDQLYRVPGYALRVLCLEGSERNAIERLLGRLAVGRRRPTERRGRSQNDGSGRNRRIAGGTRLRRSPALPARPLPPPSWRDSVARCASVNLPDLLATAWTSFSIDSVFR